jgi:hypothetical protein
LVGIVPEQNIADLAMRIDANWNRWMSLALTKGWSLNDCGQDRTERPDGQAAMRAKAHHGVRQQVPLRTV